jgi:hypothetical protein
VQQLLDPPQVRRLPGERRPVHAPQRGELPQVVAAEVGVDALVGVQAQELPGQFHREHLAVGQGRCPAVAPQRPGRPRQPPQFLVDQAEHVQQVVVKGHGGLPRQKASTQPF